MAEQLLDITGTRDLRATPAGNPIEVAENAKCAIAPFGGATPAARPSSRRSLWNLFSCRVNGAPSTRTNSRSPRTGAPSRFDRARTDRGGGNGAPAVSSAPPACGPGSRRIRSTDISAGAINQHPIPQTAQLTDTHPTAKARTSTSATSRHRPAGRDTAAGVVAAAASNAST